MLVWLTLRLVRSGTHFDADLPAGPVALTRDAFGTVDWPPWRESLESRWMMSLRQYRYGVALAAEGNFRRAAERCCATGSTLGGPLKRCEGELGIDLFERRLCSGGD